MSEQSLKEKFEATVKSVGMECSKTTARRLVMLGIEIGFEKGREFRDGEYVEKYPTFADLKKEIEE